MHNVGAIFRTSDAFLVEKIYLCGITAQPPHRDIRKTALGAEESIAWEHVEDSLSLLKTLSDYEIYALEQTEKSIKLRDFKHSGKKIALIVGNEVDGVQQELLDFCHASIEIPQFGTKHSFNVSVSTGIALWEIFNKIHES